jgi:hypothetical protein
MTILFAEPVKDVYVRPQDLYFCFCFADTHQSSFSGETRFDVSISTHHDVPSHGRCLSVVEAA